MMPVVQIATRKSLLALWQAQTTQNLLKGLGLNVELFPLVTTGDKMQKSQLADVHLNTEGQHHLTTGKGLFIKEIQEALITGKAHIAVHSMKDLPVTQTKGLSVVSLLPRAGACDVLVLSPMVIEQIGLDKKSDDEIKNLSFQELKKLLLSSKKFCEDIIGTTSTRRQMLLKKLVKEDLNLQILRGNVDTRLKRLRNNEFAAIILAEAGLERLNLMSFREMFPLSVKEFIPATGQGVIAIEVLEANTSLVKKVSKLCCHKTAIQAGVERLVLFLLGGDCHSSIGVHFNGSEIFIICGRNGLLKETCIFIDKSEVKLLQYMFEQCEYIYSKFFEKLCSSSFAQKTHSHLLQNHFSAVSEISKVQF